jgi:hypothetical protein
MQARSSGSALCSSASTTPAATATAASTTPATHFTHRFLRQNPARIAVHPAPIVAGFACFQMLF